MSGGTERARGRTGLRRAATALAVTGVLAGGLALQHGLDRAAEAPAGLTVRGPVGADAVGLPPGRTVTDLEHAVDPGREPGGPPHAALAAVVSDGGCGPSWADGTDRAEQADAVRARGGDVLVSFGGDGPATLERSCATGAGLADAYLATVDRYRLRAVDVHLPADSLADPDLRARVVDALRRLLAARPGTEVYLTLGADRGVLPAAGADLAAEAAAARLGVNAWSVAGATDPRAAVDGLAAVLEDAYGYDAAAALRHSGAVLAEPPGPAASGPAAELRTLRDQGRLGRVSFTLAP